jgi:hypothetical protein
MNPLDRLGPRPDLTVIRDDVRAIDAYAVPSAVGFVKLDAMENPFSLPEGLQQKLGERLGKQALNRYPLSDPRGFKERLGRAVGLPPGMQLMLGNGSDELIHLVILACAKPGTTVLAPAPSFVMYEMSARFDHCNYVGVPLKENFALDTERMLKAIDEHRPARIADVHADFVRAKTEVRQLAEQAKHIIGRLPAIEVEHQQVTRYGIVNFGKVFAARLDAIQSGVQDLVTCQTCAADRACANRAVAGDDR